MKIALFSCKSYDKLYFSNHTNSKQHQIVLFEAPLNVANASLTKGFEAVCVFVNDQLNAETLDLISANGVKTIALRCAGFNNVDIEKAKSLGMGVYRVPSYSPEAVAEHAVALMMTLCRKTHKAYNRVREGNFSLERLDGFNINGKTIGVVGTGQIGSAFCKIALGFGARVIAYDLFPSDDLKKIGVDYVGFDELLRLSDIISLHCPLTSNNHHMFSDAQFEKMKEGAMLINSSRGGLVDTKAAIRSLKHGHLGYLGLDVYEQEAGLFFSDHSEEVIQDDLINRLMSFPNVLVTAHQAFFTKEAMEEIATVTLQNISDAERGIVSKNLVW